jgi:hypothetical protein
MIDRGHALSVTKQAESIGISRSTVYYRPRPVSAQDLALMREIDALHIEFPFAGAVVGAQPSGCQGTQDWPSSRQDADAADGDRGLVPPAADDEAGAGP